ncbi:glycosyltransferase family 4 protein [Aromatoleum aromaticum]|uniref:glycosyltransferase family 4 protein n=1 Tax=Aromatoleum aromaticum TaxID=551760 RepID=UPI001459595B|nr:glycosyltransferase family 4 protein [Aromatoleum aromaticum]NMG56732.1 glycosyltransferase [Aromatoleum aromaticum]
MNIIVTACQVPFIFGGATHQVNGLVGALQAAGHNVELLRFPFQFQPEAAIHRLMAHCEELDLAMPNGQRVDRVISLQFPGYGVQHPHHIVWVMHQHRAVYELFDPASASPELARLRTAVSAWDTRILARAHHRFAESARVAERLRHYNGLDSEPLAHPPAFADAFRCAPAEPYIFYPSRLETLKRQELLIEAARHLRSPVAILIAGTGGQHTRYQHLIARYGLEGRVRLLGHITEAEKIAFYAHALGVFFAPFDEDYGYITLEAMLSSKPVLTCTDSGGPLEFVVAGETGSILPPQPEAIAAAIDALHAAPEHAAAMGRAGLARYRSLGITWAKTVERLLAA